MSDGTNNAVPDSQTNPPRGGGAGGGAGKRAAVADSAYAVKVMARWLKKSDENLDLDLDAIREAATELLDSADPRSVGTGVKALLALHAKAADIARHIDDKERASKLEHTGEVKFYGFDPSAVGKGAA